MSFDDTAREPEQTFGLNRDPAGELEYPTKYGGARAKGVRGLLLGCWCHGQMSAEGGACPRSPELPPRLCPALVR